MVASTKSPSTKRVAQKPLTLPISEIFGPTIQGEGLNAGKRAMFLRLAHCNLTCSWCDTAYSWDWKRFDVKQETERLTLEEIRERLSVDTDDSLIVITGGEPMIYQDSGLIDLIESVRDRNGDLRQFEIETNGTFEPRLRWPNIRYSVSPKLANSGMDYDTRINIPVLNQYAANNAVLKFVVENDDCIREIQEILGKLSFTPDRVWLMPQGQTAAEMDDRLKFLTEAAIDNGFNVSDRLHIRVWGMERGH